MFDFFKTVFNKKKEEPPPIIADITIPSPQKSLKVQGQSSGLILPRENSEFTHETNGFKYQIIANTPDSDDDLFDSLLNETISEDITLLKTPEKSSKFIMPTTFEKTPVSNKVSLSVTPLPSPKGNIKIKKDQFRFSTKSSAAYALNMLPREDKDIGREATDQFFIEFDRWYFHKNKSKEDEQKKYEENEVVREAYDRAVELYSALEEELRLWEEINIEANPPIPKPESFDQNLNISVRFKDLEDVVFSADNLQLLTQRVCAEQERIKDAAEDVSQALYEITSYPIDPISVVEQTV